MFLFLLLSLAVGVVDIVPSTGSVLEEEEEEDEEDKEAEEERGHKR